MPDRDEPSRDWTGPPQGPKPLRLFLFVAAASSGGPGQTGPVGLSAPRHPLIVFVAAQSEPEATRHLILTLPRQGWFEVDIQGSREIPADPQTEADEHVRRAMAQALEDGLAIIVYGVGV